MPAMDISPPRSIPLNDRLLLKAHKALPRKRDLVLDTSPPIVQVSTSNHSATPNGTVYPVALSLLLTPPSLPPDSQGDGLLPTSRQVQEETSPETNGKSTPTRHFNPLTPDVTPPPTLNPPRSLEAQQVLRPSVSSRTESFKTAREALSSDEDLETVTGSTSQSTARPQKQGSPPDPHPLRKSSRPGDTHAYSDANRSGDSTPQKQEADKSDTPRFDTFDGQWTERREPDRSRRRRKQPKLNQNQDVSPAHKPPVEAPLRPKKKTQEVLQASQHTDRSSTSDDQRPDSWRLSGASTTTTIEAIVIDSPPQKPRALRHARKNPSLRSASSPVPPPRTQLHVRTSSDTVDVQPHLTHKSRRLTNEHRWSFTSDVSLTPSVTSSRQKPTDEVIQVVVIPQRRSSLRSSARNSRSLSRGHSINSARRPTTAPDGATGSLDIMSRRRRPVSETRFSSGDKDRLIRSSTATRPKIPARSSSLSAPTSRNSSRAASLTSNSPAFQPTVHVELPKAKPKDREIAPTQATTGPQTRTARAPPPLDIRPPEQQRHSDFLNTPDDVVGFLSPSLRLLTPFQASIQSISPGPVEISEARAVPFFSHNNESILVVERGPQAVTRPAATAAAMPLAGVPMDYYRGQRTPEPQNEDAVLVDSPLRNPRSPPKPPVTNAAQNGRGQAETGQNGGTMVRRWSSLRRALSSRRNSEDTFSSALVIHHPKNPKAGKEIDSKQQPFWRPRPFWDDVNGRESDLDDGNASRSQNPTTTTEARDVNGNTYIGNSLGIPQNKVIFHGPLSLIRRMSNRSRHRAARDVNISHVSLASTILSQHSHRMHRLVIPGLRLELPFISLKKMQERIRRTRRQREEERLEARRENLRRQIGPRVPIDDAGHHTVVISGNRRL